MNPPSQSPAASAVLDVERVRAVPMPRSHFGYRSRLGDIVELQDGRLLMAYKASAHSGGDVPAGGEGPGANVGIGTRTSGDVLPRSRRRPGCQGPGALVLRGRRVVGRTGVEPQEDDR